MPAEREQGWHPGLFHGSSPGGSSGRRPPEGAGDRGLALLLLQERMERDVRDGEGCAGWRGMCGMTRGCTEMARGCGMGAAVPGWRGDV